MSSADYIREYRVLYVDDEQANLIVFEAAYGDEFDVVCASSGDEALRILAQQPIAVLVTDFKMPGMSGVELCERVRAQYPKVRRILATAYSDQRTAVAAINRAGVQRYIEKPLEPDIVVSALRESIGQVHLEQTMERLRATVVERERLAALAAARASVLHDLGNMSAVVSACAANLRALLDRPSPSVPGDVREEIEELLAAVDYVNCLQGRTRQLGGLVPGVRDLYRVEDVLRSAVRLLDHRGGCGVRLVVEPTEATVYADRIDVCRIVANLVGNAIDAITEAGICDGEVRLKAVQVRERVLIQVADNGPGIPPEIRDQVFAVSFTTRKAHGGSGLGLAICCELAEANGGSVHISERTQARGATMVVTLPAEQPARDERVRQPATPH